jgi:hypothetical protein
VVGSGRSLGGAATSSRESPMTSSPQEIRRFVHGWRGLEPDEGVGAI